MGFAKMSCFGCKAPLRFVLKQIDSSLGGGGSLVRADVVLISPCFSEAWTGITVLKQKLAYC